MYIEKLRENSIKFDVTLYRRSPRRSSDAIVGIYFSKCSIVGHSTAIQVASVRHFPSSKTFKLISSGGLYKAWSPYSCNGRKHRHKHVSDSVPSSCDTREHFDYNIASLAGTVINCSVSSSCNDRSNH